MVAITLSKCLNLCWRVCAIRFEIHNFPASQDSVDQIDPASGNVGLSHEGVVACEVYLGVDLFGFLQFLPDIRGLECLECFQREFGIFGRLLFTLNQR